MFVLCLLLIMVIITCNGWTTKIYQNINCIYVNSGYAYFYIISLYIILYMFKLIHIQLYFTLMM